MKVKQTMKLLTLFCLGILFLSGCNTQDKTSTEAVTNAENSQNETRIITTTKGDIEIPSDPKRIVIQSYVGDLLSLGVKPIAGDMRIDLFDDLLTEDEYTTLEDFDAETIMALNPDLIILMDSTEAADYDQLSQIAPTISLDDKSMSTDDRVTYIGEIVGKEAEAEKAVSDYNKLAQDNKQRLEEAGIINKTITVMEEEYLFGAKYGRGADIVYNYLGFTAPQKLNEKFESGEFFLEVSMEVLHEYCGDYILRSVYDGAADLSNNNVWNTISAVKNNNIIEIDFNQFYARDIYVMSKQMVYITDALLSTVQ